jgi:hypothetical protein
MALQAVSTINADVVIGGYTFPADATPISIATPDVDTYVKMQQFRDAIYASQIAVSGLYGELHQGNDGLAYLDEIIKGNIVLS